MKDKLAASRARLDALDRKIAALLARRFKLAGPLRALKGRASDPARERRVLANAARAAGVRYSAAARHVFSEIIRQTKKLQPEK